jgi:hypothetical protein
LRGIKGEASNIIVIPAHAEICNSRDFSDTWDVLSANCLGCHSERQRRIQGC